MRRPILLIAMIASIFVSGFCWAGTFLDAPLPEGGVVVRQSDSFLEETFNKPYEEVLAFYSDTFKEEKDIKFRDRPQGVYIEEYNVRPWHSISIMKKDQETIVLISKDSWTWILGTLTLRFMAVFIVLIALFIPLSITGLIISKHAAKKKATK